MGGINRTHTELPQDMLGAIGFRNDQHRDLSQRTQLVETLGSALTTMHHATPLYNLSHFLNDTNTHTT